MLSQRGRICDMPSHMFFLGQNKPCSKMLQRSGGRLKCLKCSTVSQTASSFRCHFRCNRSTVFSVSVLPTVSSWSLWGGSQESFTPLRPCLNRLGTDTNRKCMLRNTVGLALTGPYTIVHETISKSFRTFRP